MNQICPKRVGQLGLASRDCRYPPGGAMATPPLEGGKLLSYMMWVRMSVSVFVGG